MMEIAELIVEVGWLLTRLFLVIIASFILLLIIYVVVYSVIKVLVMRIKRRAGPRSLERSGRTEADIRELNTVSMRRTKPKGGSRDD